MKLNFAYFALALFTITGTNAKALTTAEIKACAKPEIAQIPNIKDGKALFIMSGSSIAKLLYYNSIEPGKDASAQRIEAIAALRKTIAEIKDCEEAHDFMWDDFFEEHLARSTKILRGEQVTALELYEYYLMASEDEFTEKDLKRIKQDLKSIGAETIAEGFSFKHYETRALVMSTLPILKRDGKNLTPFDVFKQDYKANMTADQIEEALLNQHKGNITRALNDLIKKN